MVQFQSGCQRDDRNTIAEGRRSASSESQVRSGRTSCRSRASPRFIVGFTLASVVLFTIAVYFTLRRVLKPLRETSAAAARIDAQNISKRLSTRNLPVEFLPVVDAFNLTLDRLERGYIVQRAFLAGAAHQLETPLALIRAQIDMEGTTDREVL